MTPRLFKVLRSRELAVYLFLVVSLLALYGSLIPAEKAETVLGRFGGGLLLLGRTLGLVDTYHSPLFVFLMVLLCVNLAFCTVSRFLRRGSVPAGEAGGRRSAVRWLDLLLHASVLVLLAGGAAKGLWGFTGTKNIHVGTTANTVLDWRLGYEVPLGFSIAVKDRVDEYYPAEMRIGVANAATGEKLGLVEVGGRYGEGLPAAGVSLSLLDFDRAGLRARLGAVIDGREVEFELLGEEEGGGTDTVGPYIFTLVAWRQELKTVRSLLTILEGEEAVKEEWIAPNARVSFKRTSLYQTAWGEDQYRNPYVGIQVVRDPGGPVFWAGGILFSLTLPLYLLVRHGGRSSRRG